MKKCPQCMMTLEAEVECPICGHSLVYEDEVYGFKEELIFNKYLAKYLFKNIRFALVCSIITAIILIANREKAGLFFIYPSILAVSALINALFERHIYRWQLWRYNENYARFICKTGKYILAVGAVITSFMVVTLIR